MVAKTNTKTLNGKINTDGKNDGYRTLSKQKVFAQMSRTDISECRGRDGKWKQNTLSHAHFSQWRTLDHRSSHAPACGSSLGCVAPLRIFKVIHSQHVPSTTPWCAWPTFSLFVPRHLRLHRPHCLWLESKDLPAPLRTEDFSLGRMVETYTSNDVFPFFVSLIIWDTPQNESCRVLCACGPQNLKPCCPVPFFW